MKDSEKGLSTFLNHPPRVTLKEYNYPTVSPIYQAAKFVVSDVAPYTDQFFYSRISNPTLTELEQTLAHMQGVDEGIVFASGLAAITNSLLALLQKGDHVLFFREIYRPARIFLSQTCRRFGIEGTMLPMGDFDLLEKSVQPGKTKLLYFESPSNPNLMVTDIRRLRAFADKHGLILMMDNTFSGPHQHKNLGVDIFIHSLTKFANGHGDVIAGAALGSSDLIKKIKSMAIIFGATLDPHAAFLVQRGLKTYELRYQKQTQNAQALTAYLRSEKLIKKVYYPDGELERSQLRDLGAVVSLELDPACGMTAQEFCHKTKLIQFAVSLGSLDTLISPTEIFFADDLSKKDREEMGLNSYSLRISVGIENIEDIIADFKAALGSA
jgi:cystathionine beta-lyase/cystathionine gamma-synthase